jgi:hypothetical protein
MQTRYFKRNWEESRGDNYDSWGTSEWYFEVEPNGNVIRQIEVYKNGPTLRYGDHKLEDDYGGLSDQSIDLEEFKDYEIDTEIFLKAWEAS